MRRSSRPGALQAAPPGYRGAGAGADGPVARPSPFDLLVEALQATFTDGFGGVAPRFIALEVWALAHGLATLSSAGHLPRGPGFPDKFELAASRRPRPGAWGGATGTRATRAPGRAALESRSRHAHVNRVHMNSGAQP